MSMFKAPPPPPTGNEVSSPSYRDWFFLVTQALKRLLGVLPGLDNQGNFNGSVVAVTSATQVVGEAGTSWMILGFGPPPSVSTIAGGSPAGVASGFAWKLE